MTQQVARVFEAGIAERPEDWHMLQRVFSDDLDLARLAAAQATAQAAEATAEDAAGAAKKAEGAAADAADAVAGRADAVAGRAALNGHAAGAGAGRPGRRCRCGRGRERAVRIGVVCPYTWDVPSRVQEHPRTWQSTCCLRWA